MSTLYVNNISPTSGDTVAVTGSMTVTGDVTVTGSLNAHVSDFRVQADTMTLGDAGADVATVTAQLTASEGILLANNRKLILGHVDEYVYGDGTDIHIGVGSGGDINVPANIGLTFGDDGEKIEGDGTDLAINSSRNTTMTSAGVVRIVNDFEVSGSTQLGNAKDDIVTIKSQVSASGGMTVSSQLTASEGMFVGGNSRITLGHADEYIYADGTDIHIGVGSGGDINVPADIGLTFGNDGEKIEGDGTDLAINSSRNTTMTSAGVVRIVNDFEVSGSTQLGNAGEDIVTVTAQLTASEGALLNNSLIFKDGATARGAIRVNTANMLTFHDKDDAEIFRIDGAADSLLMATNKKIEFSDGDEHIVSDGSVLTIAGDLINLDSAGDILLDADGANIFFQDNGKTIGGLNNAAAAGNYSMQVSASVDLHLTGTAVRMHSTQGIYGDAPLSIETIYTGSFAAFFNNVGGEIEHYGIRILAGKADGAGTTYYVLAVDGDGDNVGHISNVDGTFALGDLSDERIKEDIRDTKLRGLEILNNIKVRDFELKKNGISKTGLIAQELQDVYPAAVQGSPDEIGPDGRPAMMSVAYATLVPPLVKAFQELSEEVTNLKKEITKLKRKK